MPTYTLDELIELNAPQHKLDQALIRDCIKGLTVYAAQHAQADPNSPKVPEMRQLVECLAGYWGLDDGSTEILENEYMKPFDESIKAAKNGAEIDDGHQHSASVINGLYRYGEEMVCAQGADLKSDIIATGELMKEIASAWDFESSTLDDLTARLEAEAQSLGEPEPVMGGMQ